MEGGVGGGGGEGGWNPPRDCTFFFSFGGDWAQEISRTPHGSVEDRWSETGSRLHKIKTAAVVADSGRI